MFHLVEIVNGKVTIATRGKKRKRKPLKNESMNTKETKGTKVTDGTKGTNGTNGTKVTNEAKGKKHRKSVQIDLDELIHESKEQFELLQAVYNALANTHLRNLEDRYEGDRWFVMCKGTDIITNELGDIIRESDDEILAHANGIFAIAASYSEEVFALGGTAEKIYISQ